MLAACYDTHMYVFVQTYVRTSYLYCTYILRIHCNSKFSFKITRTVYIFRIQIKYSSQVKAALYFTGFFFVSFPFSSSTYFPFCLEGFSQVTNINSIITTTIALEHFATLSKTEDCTYIPDVFLLSALGNQILGFNMVDLM